MNLEELKTKIDIVHKFVTTIAIIIAGLWVVYTFNAQLYKVIEVVVDSKVISQYEDKYLIEITVLISNKGGIEHDLLIQKKSLRITRIILPELPQQPTLTRVILPVLPQQPHIKSGQFIPVPLMTNINGDVTGINYLPIPPGGQNSLLYLARVDQYGSYLIEFSTQDAKYNLNIELAANEIIHILPQDAAE